MVRYLVTGSAGFIGFHIAKALLEREEEVLGIDNMNPYYSVKLKEDRNSILKGFQNYTFYQVELADREKLVEILDAVRARDTDLARGQVTLHFSRIQERIRRAISVSDEQQR